MHANHSLTVAYPIYTPIPALITSNYIVLLYIYCIVYIYEYNAHRSTAVVVHDIVYTHEYNTHRSTAVVVHDIVYTHQCNTHRSTAVVVHDIVKKMDYYTILDNWVLL